YFPGDPRNDLPPRVSSYLGNGSVREFKGLVSTSMPLGSGVDFHGTLNASMRDALSPDAFFRMPLDGRTVRSIHPDGFRPEIASDIQDFSSLLGVRGNSRGWRWDVTAGWGGNSVSYEVNGSNNASLGSGSPTSFRSGSVATQLWSANADIGRDMQIGSMPVGMAGGLELRVERHSISAGEPDSWRDGGVPILDGPMAGFPAAAGAQGMVGYRPDDEVNAHRTTSALWLEAAVRPLSRLLLQPAVRLEHFSDVGNTADGKLAARVEVSRGIAIRGSLGTGFRAPSLTQQHFASSRTIYHQVDGVNTVLTVRTFPASTPEARLMGASRLKPEQAVNLSAGVVLQLPALLRLTADVYRIDLDDGITLIASVSDPEIVRMFEENGMRGIGGGNYFANAIDTRTSGVDVVASRSFKVGNFGMVALLAGYNHTRTRVTNVTPPPAEIARFESAWFNRT